MTKLLRLTAILVLAAAIMPLSANAQEQKSQAPAKAAPAARAPAARPAPAARAAPAARPAPTVRVAPQRQAPQRAAAPQRAPQRAAAPTRQAAPRTLQHQAPQRTAAPQRATAPTRQATPRTLNAPARTAAPASRSTAPSAATAPSTRAQLRSQQRQERTLRQQETRQLRALPPAQRAQKQQEINQQRQQRAQQRLQPNVQAQPKALVQPNAQVQRSTRRNGVARVTPQAAQQGRFAARYAGRAQRLGLAAVAPRRAWSRGLRAAFVPWYGPVFWPYAYSDVFDYAFWPSGYDDGYWAYAYDDFFDGVFWGEAGPPPDYGYASAAPNTPAARPSNAAVQELCTQPGTGITAWPFAEINSKVGLNPDQKQLLDQVRSSGQKAAAVFKASCPAANAFARTPPGRLQAMTLRLGATLEAVQTVRPAMVTFYDSLNDEQKERFNAIGPKQPKDSAEASQASAQDGKSCSEPKAGLTNLPIERIEDAVKPTDAQEDGLKQLEDATAKAVSIMQAACPEDTPITPPGRLEAMEKRLQAMIDAANTVKPALNGFYDSLSSEQKARFNRIGGELALSGN